MSEPLTVNSSMLATSPEVIDQIRGLQEKLVEHENTIPFKVQTEHVLHGGMYARTIRLAPAVLIVGVLIKIPTLLIVHGDCEVFAGNRWYAIKDYQVIPTSAGRKQVYVTRGATEITMLFPTSAKTVEEAEAEFTDEAGDLLSRRKDCDDIVIITGEACQA